MMETEVLVTWIFKALRELYRGVPSWFRKSVIIYRFVIYRGNLEI